MGNDIINDGSKDASADICERYALVDKRIRLLNQKIKEHQEHGILEFAQLKVNI